ncbi:MAG: hypothetical protein GWP17_05925, partial [Aquificales bacterium]|nr:hypothetical protein [Aquificales bacterium]
VHHVPEFEDTLMAVFDATTDEEVVHAFKAGWYSQFRGWAHDSSGAYFVYKPRGGGADLLHPRNPVYKLMMPGFTPRGIPVPMYPTVTPNTSSDQIPEGRNYVFGNLFRKHSLYRLAMQTSVEAGWYIDDLLVEDTGSTPQTNIGGYTVFGLNSVWLRRGSDLHSGSVGALDASEGAVLNRESEVTIGRKVIFHDPASTIMGDSVTLKRKAVVNDVFYNEISIAKNAVYSETSTPLTVPLPIILPPFPEINPGTVDYTIARNDSPELPAGAYGSVTMKKNSVLTLTGGIYHFENINIGRKSQLLITAPTEIRIANRLQPGARAVIGPAPGSGLDAADLVIFVEGVNGNDGGLNSWPKTAVIGYNNILTANIYVPNGVLWIRRRTEAAGAFIAKDIKIGNDVQLWLESAFAGEYQSP